jgi:hypothetical protein
MSCRKQAVSVVLENVRLVTTAGSSSSFLISAVAAESMSALRAVYRAADGFRLADANDAARVNVVGITTTSASIGASVDARIFGEMVDNGWSWVVNQKIWLGASGQLTQTIPSVGYQVEIGIAVEAQKILINIEPALGLEN